MALRIRLRRPAPERLDTRLPDREPHDFRSLAPGLPDRASAAAEEEYIVEVEEQEARTPVLAQFLGIAQAVLFGLITVLSLAIFWTVGLLIGAF